MGAAHAACGFPTRFSVILLQCDAPAGEHPPSRFRWGDNPCECALALAWGRITGLGWTGLDWADILLRYRLANACSSLSVAGGGADSDRGAASELLHETVVGT